MALLSAGSSQPDAAPPALSKETLMAHMRALCQGPRPPASPEEHRAGEYVKEALVKMGWPAPGEQPFKSQNSMGWVAIPIMTISALAIPVGMLGGRWAMLAGAAIMLLAFWNLLRMLVGAPPFFQRLIARWPSRNLFLNIPPRGERRRHVFLVGHLDSQKQRFLSPIPWPQYQGLFMASAAGLGPLVLVILLLGAALGWATLPAWLWILEGMLVLSVLAFVTEEFQPHIVGANDNATAVSVLLGMAQVLRERPLANTEVTLLFTGCEEVPCVGMEAYLDAHSQSISRENSYWIDLEMVGTGSLCYITRHGMSAFTQYRPHPEMVRLAGQAAAKKPGLNVTGRDMLILEEVSNLRRRGYPALCIAGYNEQGFLPNWHRLSDNLANIEPETLERAARYTWALVQEVDGMEAKP